MHPDLKTKTKNLGVEIQAKSATKVKAARSGVIAQIVDLPGKGTSIIVDHGDSYYSVYGRLSRSKVKVGQKVNSCQEIANIGVASKSKPRLFFQVSKGVKTINPRDWLRNAQ
jgi:septal ring factor EnvC (AmiA/AmiB activator)